MANTITLRQNKTSFLTFEEIDGNFVVYQNLFNSLQKFLYVTYSQHISDYKNFVDDFEEYKKSLYLQMNEFAQTNTKNTFVENQTFTQQTNIKNIEGKSGSLDNVIIGQNVPNAGIFNNIVSKLGIIDFSLGKYLRFPQWTNSTRPNPQLNEIGFNVDSGKYESYNGIVWEFFYTSSNAGTSASKNVTTTNQDQSLNKILKVGDFGAGVPILISSSADLNTYTIPGKYHQPYTASAASGLNYPTPIAGTLEVIPWGNNVMVQRYYVYSDPRPYIRCWTTDSGGSWTTWSQQLLDDTYNAGLNTKVNRAGDSMSGILYINGTLTTNNNLKVNGATYQTDGNVYGGAFGGYLSTWLNNGVNQINANIASLAGSRVSPWYDAHWIGGINISNFTCPSEYYFLGTTNGPNRLLVGRFSETI